MDHQKKLLIIEDEKPLRESLRIKFQRENMEVFVAGDGEDGFTVALQEHPDLILLDMLMPNVDGISFLKDLRQDPWGEKVKVIILTNYSDLKKELQAKDFNVMDYIIKSDWKLEDLVAKVHQYLK